MSKEVTEWEPKETNVLIVRKRILTSMAWRLDDTEDRHKRRNMIKEEWMDFLSNSLCLTV